MSEVKHRHYAGVSVEVDVQSEARTEEKDKLLCDFHLITVYVYMKENTRDLVILT